MSREQIISFWPGLLGRMSARPDSVWSPFDVLVGGLSGKMQMWALTTGDMLDAVVATQVLEERDGGRVLDVVGAWGEALEGHEPAFAERMETMAKVVGASRIVVEGRPGWTRRLRRLGYVPTRVTLVKEVAPATRH